MALRILAGILAANRVVFGVGYLVAPQRTAGGWVGRAGRTKASTVITRALGARDLSLGGGALVALLEGDEAQARRWFGAQAVADAVDLAATLRVRDGLPTSGFRFGTAMAGASTAIALAAALGLRLD